LRLLHFLALAVLAASFVPPNWRGLRTPVMRGAIRCGENSLPIYCLGVLLALASHAALLDISDGLAMQIALSLGGILVMIIAAMLLSSIGIKTGATSLREAIATKQSVSPHAVPVVPGLRAAAKPLGMARTGDA
jgi:hypothetical protein